MSKPLVSEFNIDSGRTTDLRCVRNSYSPKSLDMCAVLLDFGHDERFRVSPLLRAREVAAYCLQWSGLRSASTDSFARAPGSQCMVMWWLFVFVVQENLGARWRK